MLGAACTCCVGRSNKLSSNRCAQNVLCKRCQWCKMMPCFYLMYMTSVDYTHTAFAVWSWNTISRSKLSGTALTLKLQCDNGQSCHTDPISASLYQRKTTIKHRTTIIFWHGTLMLLQCCVRFFLQRVFSIVWRNLSAHGPPLPWPLLNYTQTLPSICV